MTKTKPRNRAECAVCLDIIESKSVHDFVRCKCGAIFVDGGNEYWRWGFDKEENFIRLTEEYDE